MPRMDGLEICRRLRADGRTVTLPIIVLTAHTSTSDMVAALDAGSQQADRFGQRLPGVALEAPGGQFQGEGMALNRMVQRLKQNPVVRFPHPILQQGYHIRLREAVKPVDLRAQKLRQIFVAGGEETGGVCGQPIQQVAQLHYVVGPDVVQHNQKLADRLQPGGISVRILPRLVPGQPGPLTQHISVKRRLFAAPLKQHTTRIARPQAAGQLGGQQDVTALAAGKLVRRPVEAAEQGLPALANPFDMFARHRELAAVDRLAGVVGRPGDDRPELGRLRCGLAGSAGSRAALEVWQDRSETFLDPFLVGNFLMTLSDVERSS